MSLPGDAWMDEDDRHVWWQHDCVDAEGKRVQKCWMLPWPHWRKGEGASPTTKPSIICTVPGCNYHASPLIRTPPADWKPRMAIPGNSVASTRSKT